MCIDIEGRKKRTGAYFPSVIVASADIPPTSEPGIAALVLAASARECESYALIPLSLLLTGGTYYTGKKGALRWWSEFTHWALIGGWGLNSITDV